MQYPKIIENLIESLAKLPGVGRRSAERMVFWMLNSKDDAMRLAENIVELKDNLMFCRVCNNLSDAEVCMVCTNPSRDEGTICVVENPKDVLAIEKTGAFKGHYHVLLGAISPTDGRGPESLKIQHLFNRIRAGEIKEIVIATDADSDGEMTALYLLQELQKYDVKVSRIGFGIPLGSAVEYADISTLSMSLNSRRELKI